MALRRKRNQQQSDEEKLQELLQKWDIQLPDKKSDFPETSLNDFPKADFPVSASKKPETVIHQDEKKPEVKLQSFPDKKSENNISAPEKSETVIHQDEKKPEVKLNLFLDKKSGKKQETPANLLNQNPDLDKLFKQQAIQHLHGTVRMYSLESFFLILLIMVFGLTCMYDALEAVGIICFCVIFLMVWRMTRWELKFDGKTNRFSYKSLQQQEIQFHASQIQNVKVKRTALGFKKILILTVFGQEIRISLGVLHIYFSKREGYRQGFVGGFYNAHKLKEYLNFYQDLHGNFGYAGFEDSDGKVEINFRKRPAPTAQSVSKQELMQMMKEYQEQIDKKNKE